MPGSNHASKMKTAIMKAAMSGLYHASAHRILAPYTQGVGLIFTLHHVRPEPEQPRAFAPNRILEITPKFLDAVLDQVQEAGLDVLSLDDATQRLRENDDRRFACFTFDGYRSRSTCQRTTPMGPANCGGSHSKMSLRALLRSSYAATAGCGG